VDAARYDRARPQYPAGLIARIVAESPGRSVLDVGTGTGIIARQLQAAGCAVLGVEPDARMASFARETGVETEVGKIEDWNPAGRTFDAAVSGMTWHWVDPVVGAVAVAQALRPGGLLALFWNAFELPGTVSEALATTFRRVVPDALVNFAAGQQTLDMYGGMLDKAEAGLREAGGFGAPERWRFEWQQTYTRDEWLDQLPTQGLLTRLPAEKQAEIAADVGAAIDALGGGFTMRYASVALAAHRLP
jgi:SAM-dependent methyltransferase